MVLQGATKPISDDLEMRICRDRGSHKEDIHVEIVDILVQ